MTEEKKTQLFKTFKRLVAVLLSETYSMHGYQDYAVDVSETITELAVLLVKNALGEDIPMTIDHAKRRRLK